MSNKQQTAVEWFSELSLNQFNLFQEGHISISEFKNRMSSIEIKAKEMHRQEIINAVDGYPIANRYLDGNEYYEQTYGGNK